MPEAMRKRRDADNAEATIDTPHLIIGILERIDCTPTIDDDGAILINYEDEDFQIFINDQFVRIWDPAWTAIKDDNPNLPLLQEAVNKANFSFGATVVMSEPLADGLIYLSSRRDIMLNPADPNKDNFFISVLDSFFDTRKNVADFYVSLPVSLTRPRRRRTIEMTKRLNLN